MARNFLTRLGRPPKPRIFTQPTQPMTGERQGMAPTDGLDMAVPGRAFKRGGSTMPSWHQDPKFACKGGRIK